MYQWRHHVPVSINKLTNKPRWGSSAVSPFWLCWGSNSWLFTQDGVPYPLSHVIPKQSYLTYHCLHHCQFLNHKESLYHKGHWGTTDDLTMEPLYSSFPLFSNALWDFPSSNLIHSLMLSSHLFLYPPSFVPPFTLCLSKWLWLDPMSRTYHCSFSLLTINVSVQLPARSWHILPH